MKILFQGDSITDASRNREQIEPNTGMGLGYPNHVAGQLLYANPEKNYEFYNRGISGNRVVDLYARWKIDALNIKPDVLSILIGVNDTWHEKNYCNGVELDRYEQVYTMLLEWTKKELPNVKLILCEPFVFPIGAAAEDWVPEIDARRAIVKKLAEKFDAVFITLQDKFDAAATKSSQAYWLGDGVHPTPAGHALIAEAWINATKEIL